MSHIESQFESKDVDLEEYLMSNLFYSYDKQPSTMKSAQVPTSFMKNSPSIKALENILNEKSKSFNYNLNNLSVQSVQTFHTANELTSSRMDTIDASPLSYNDSTVHESEEVFSKTGNSGKDSNIDEERATNGTDNEDTLIEETVTAPKYIKMPSLIPEDIKEKDVREVKERRKSMLDVVDEFDIPPVQVPKVQTPKTPTTQTSKALPRVQSMVPPSQTFNLPSYTPKSQPQAQTPKEQTKTPKTQTPRVSQFGSFDTAKLSSMTPSPRKSPHVRSSSAFNLTTKKESPGKHKRSSTLTDLANFKQASDEKKPKFSFKSLFKKKDKKETTHKKEKQEPAKKEKQDAGKKNKAMKQQAPESPVRQQYASDSANIKLPSEKPGMNTAFKSNTNINFIREVTEDYLDPLQQFNDEYDTHNLSEDPAQKISGSNKYGEEMMLEPSPLPKSNNPFVNYNPVLGPEESNAHYYNDDDDIFGSPKRNSGVNEQLLGDSLFPKSLNPQEVESIVSLERSRSMKSVKSSKRTSFVNYDGSDENIILFNESFNNSFNSPVSNVSRSNSILKKSKFGSIDSKIKNTPGSTSVNEENDFGDLMEFSDFINFDNAQGINLNFDVDQLNASEPAPSLQTVSNAPAAKLQPSPIEDTPSQDIPRRISHIGSNDSPIIISSSSSIEEDSEEPIRPLNISPRTPEITVSQQQFNLLTPNLEEIEKSPEVKISPVLNTKNTDKAARPISMSFKGLKGPSFGDRIANKTLRNSDSHQSFNISFNDDSDYSGSAVGGGFGSSDEDDDYLSDDLGSQDEKENYRDLQPPVPPKTRNAHGYQSPSYSSPSFNSPSFDQSPRSYAYTSPSTLRSPDINTPSARSVPGRSPDFRSPLVKKVSTSNVRFSSRIILYETYNGDEYDRHPDTATCNQLTPTLAQMIREELNQLKATMTVHDDSRCYTHFL